MLYLLEVSFANDKESQAIYPYEDIVALEADFETKLGQAMTAKTPELLIALDNIGKVVKGSNYSMLIAKYGDHDFSPRLYECKTKDGAEDEPDLTKCDDTAAVTSKYHTKKGAAMKDATVRQEVLYGFVNDTQVEYCQWVRPVPIPEPEPQPEPTPEEPTE